MFLNFIIFIVIRKVSDIIVNSAISGRVSESNSFYVSSDLSDWLNNPLSNSKMSFQVNLYKVLTQFGNHFNLTCV
jgi:hypothetical protein